uniref:Uncharacterized protein n=1 Tax=Aegilops tauschii subsp. strangulata TaxID=200361 RepID=A0A453FKD8_AEGTS
GIECFSFQFLCSARCCHLWNLDKLTNPAVVATARVSDIRPVLASFEGRDIAAEFLERSRRVYEQKEQKQQHGRIWRR